jgi:glyoxylase-like metal-dependent hydrolase (beta-lactamase superfamily II)
MTHTGHIDFEHGITLVDSEYKRPGLAAFYLMVEAGQAALIDTGTANSVPRLLNVLRTKGIAPAQVAYVIPTHVHLDHAGGAGEMMRQFPNAKLVVHPRGARHLIDPEKLIAGVIEVYGKEEALKSFGNIAPIPAARVIEAPDNFTLDFGGRELRFLDTPGHARHHFCVWDTRSRSLFTGDTFGISYRELDTARGAFIFPTTTPVQFDPPALRASIQRLLTFKPKQIFLTHFSRVTEIERLASDMHQLVEAFADLGGRVKTAGEKRHQLLIEGQRKILFPRLRAHGVTLSDAEIDALLSMDYELNAQGIGVWLDRAET